jgi:hypothetical protein
MVPWQSRNPERGVEDDLCNYFGFFVSVQNPKDSKKVKVLKEEGS